MAVGALRRRGGRGGGRAALLRGARPPYARALPSAGLRHTDPEGSRRPVPDAVVRAVAAEVAARAARTTPAPDPAPALYEVEDLRLSLPDRARRPLLGPAPGIEILRGVSLALRRDETLGIVGGSGSGRTTLGRAMLRLVEPTHGRLRFEGRDITYQPEAALRPVRRRRQMILQDPLSSLNGSVRQRGVISGVGGAATVRRPRCRRVGQDREVHETQDRLHDHGDAHLQRQERRYDGQHVGADLAQRGAQAAAANRLGGGLEPAPDLRTGSLFHYAARARSMSLLA